GQGVRLRRPRHHDRRAGGRLHRQPGRPVSEETSMSYPMIPPMSGRLAVPGSLPHAVPGPSSRYILPQFEERTSYGMKRLDPYTKLFEDRIIFLGVQVDDASADDIMA